VLGQGRNNKTHCSFPFFRLPGNGQAFFMHQKI